MFECVLDETDDLTFNSEVRYKEYSLMNILNVKNISYIKATMRSINFLSSMIFHTNDFTSY